jgi:hypothetical protein
MDIVRQLFTVTICLSIGLDQFLENPASSVSVAIGHKENTCLLIVTGGSSFF